MSQSGKQQIFTAIAAYGGEATSFQMFAHTSLHQASVDKLVKALVEAGELKREKKAPATGGREVFHYSIPDPTHTSADDDDDNDYDDGDYGDDECCDDDDEDEVLTPTFAVGQPNVVFLIRKDDIEGFTYGSGGHKFAREISTFVKYGSRRFERHGYAVISVFISETPIQLITAHMRAALPEITFAMTYNVSDAIEHIQQYSDEVGRAFYVENFRIFAKNYINTYSHLLPTQRDTAILVPVNEAAPDQPKTDGAAQPEVQAGSVIERLARNGMEFMNLSHIEMGEVFQKLAQNYLDNNW